MNMKKINHIYLIALLMTAVSASGEEGVHPSVYVDEGACPFECCTYREWRVEEKTDILSSPDLQSQTVGTA